MKILDVTGELNLYVKKVKQQKNKKEISRYIHAKERRFNLFWSILTSFSL